MQGLVRPQYLGPRAQRLLHRPFLQASSEVGQLQELPCRLTVPDKGAGALQPLGQLASRFQQDRLAESPRIARRSRGIDHISRDKVAVRKGCRAAVQGEDRHLLSNASGESCMRHSDLPCVKLRWILRVGGMAPSIIIRRSCGIDRIG